MLKLIYFWLRNEQKKVLGFNGSLGDCYTSLGLSGDRKLFSVNEILN